MLFKVTDGNQFLYQSKARMLLPVISHRFYVITLQGYELLNSSFNVVETRATLPCWVVCASRTVVDY